MLALYFPCTVGTENRRSNPSSPFRRRERSSNHRCHRQKSVLSPHTQRPCVALVSAAEASAVELIKQREEEEEEDRGYEKGGFGGVERDPFPSCLRRESLPMHVAMIMDGNSRWARARGLPVSAGHEAGYRSLREIVNLSCKWGIRVLTVFAFSSENWLRPKPEIDFLMGLFEGVLRKNIKDFAREGIRICIIGDSSKLPVSLQRLAKEVEDITRNNSQLELIVAVNYSGRRDIVQACHKIAQKVKHGLLEPADITESLVAQELETNCTVDFPYPDLLIRTSGELRLSNFLLWQSAYTELFFSKSLWPDFGEADYVEALCSFQKRQRRFGQRTVQAWYELWISLKIVTLEWLVLV